jgi:hypothetical protein
LAAFCGTNVEQNLMTGGAVKNEASAQQTAAGSHSRIAFELVARGLGLDASEALQRVEAITEHPKKGLDE